MADDFLAEYADLYGGAPEAPFWAHSYDATTLLLEAIKAASFVDGDSLVIDRQGVRDYLNSVSGYSGLIGTINCDEFGDCGSQRITVIHHEDPEDLAASRENVVFGYVPS